MAKLYFRYGAMGASKTANMLMVRYNYIERGQEIVLLKPSCEKRDGKMTIKSRVGLEAECTYVETFFDAFFNNPYKYACIFTYKYTYKYTYIYTYNLTYNNSFFFLRNNPFLFSHI